MNQILTQEEGLAIIKVPGNCNAVSDAESKKIAMLASTNDVEKLKKYMQGIYG